MSRLDTAERLARTILWLALASVCTLFVVSTTQQRRADLALREAAERRAERDAKEAALREQRRWEEAKADLAAKKPRRYDVKRMGPFLRGFDANAGTAVGSFTNVSSHSGVLCMAATLKNVSGRTAQSLPACVDVAAYSTPTVKVAFARGETIRLCEKEQCEVSFKEVQDIP